MKCSALRLILLSALAVASASVLPGCDSKPKVSGLACFPAASAQWIAVPGGLPPRTSSARNAIIYADRSGSMLGYIKGAAAFERPFQDLIGTLPASLREVGISTRYKAFGRTIGELPDGQKMLQTAAFYSCASAAAKTCDNQESHLDAVFSEVAAHPDAMAIILSDLWFTNSEIQTSGVTALQPQLADILADGRTIAIYGIDAPFTGTIYDLPTAGSIAHTGRHPLFMIVVGSKADVLALDNKLHRSGSRYLAEGMQSGTIRKSVFTLSPMSENSRNAAPITRGSDPAFAPEMFEAQAGVVIQQFVLSRARPVKPPRPRGSWTGPADDRFVPNAVWRGPITARTRIWYRRDRNCNQNSWLEQAPVGDGWSQDGEGRHTLTMEPAALTARLDRPGVYLVSGELTRVSVASPNPDDAWMRSAWNLTPEQAHAVANDHPNLFPTLNLSEFARLLENALATAAERKGSVVDGFSILVKVEK